jgi:hypothetical protein
MFFQRKRSSCVVAGGNILHFLEFSNFIYSPAWNFANLHKITVSKGGYFQTGLLKTCIDFYLFKNPCLEDFA